MRRTPKERFLARVSPEPTSGCWLWEGAVVRCGYGSLSVGCKTVAAHRFSYELHVGAIAPGLFVLHKCDVPLCVNPDHLFLGVDQDNALDKAAKGRGTKSKRGLPFGAVRQRTWFWGQVTVRGKKIYLGTFKTAEEASAAAMKARAELLGGRE